VEELLALGCGDERGAGLEDADGRGVFDVLAVSHEDGVVESAATARWVRWPGI